MKRMLMIAVLVSCGSQRPVTRTKTPDEDVYFCRYKKNPIRLPQGTLSLAPGGPTIATFDPKSARDVGLELTVPWGAAGQPLKATFTTGWVTYRTYLSTAQPLKVYALAPQQLGVLELGPYAAFDYLGNEGGTMRLRAPTPEGFRPTRPMEVSLKCEESSITSNGRSYDDDDDDEAPDAGEARRVELLTEQDVPVSMTPGGSTDAVLRLPKKKWVTWATVLGEQGDRLKIRLHLYPGRVTGWVPNSAVSSGEHSSDLLGGLVGGLGLRGGDGSGKPAWPRCGTGVPLYLLRDGRLEPAGELRANAAYEVVNETSDATEITLPENAWLKLEPGLKWALEPGDLAKCQTKPVNKEPARM